ncbi:MAG: PEP-CTERM sorting domain-containing protein [Candidatus Schekmanbacteria bacterium]|nr:MAG: PEP-CTERM sorting domain-containing protein [Candidatus Schekmanbacteria bacterium]
MKKKVMWTIILPFLLILIFGSYSYAVQFSTKVLDQVYAADFLKINETGMAVWESEDDREDIFLYDNSRDQIIKLKAGFNTSDKAPDINKFGDVVWADTDPVSDGGGIYFYNYSDGTISSIGGSGFYDAWYPQINSQRNIVWQGYDGSDYEIFFYDGMNIIQLTNNSYDDLYPQINDQNSILWQGSDGTDFEIFLYKDSFTTQLTDNSFDDTSAVMNENGAAAWMGFDGNDNEIFYYDGLNVTQLTDNLLVDESPVINNQGSVVWFEGGDSITTFDDLEVCLYDGLTINQITDDNDYDDFSPYINDNGEIVWTSQQRNFPYYSDIYYSDGTMIQQISTIYNNNSFPAISNSGNVVWFSTDQYGNQYVNYAEKISEPVPEPSSLFLMGGGFLLIISLRLNRKRKY